MTCIIPGYKTGNIKTKHIMQRLRSTFSVQFYCRKSKVKNGVAPIEAGININGNRFFYNLPRKAKPASFLKTEAYYLYVIEKNIRRYETECLADGETVSVDGLKEFIRNGYTRPGKNIRSLVDSFYKHLEKKVNAGTLVDSGYRKYRIAIELFLEDIDTNKPVSSITPGYCSDYCLKLDGKYENSTAVGMKTKVKTMLTYAVMNGYVKVTPWHDKISKKVKKVVVPTEMELDKVIKLDLSFNKSLERVRDLWVFAAGSGLSYCDCASLCKDDVIHEGNTYYINKNRGKTDVEYLSVLLPWAVEVFNKYNGIPPVISNQKINSFIQVVGKLAGVGVKLHFHLARHLYCHMLLNKYRVSYDVAAKMMGHSQIRQTMHYGKILKSTVLGAFENK